MELIEIKKADLGAIYNDGDEAIFKYAKAVYGVRKCFIDHGIRYIDWKQCHQFYDEGTGKLVIVDYDKITIFDGNYNLQKELHEKLEKEFSFINSEDYTESSSYKIFKDKLYDASFGE